MELIPLPCRLLPVTEPLCNSLITCHPISVREAQISKWVAVEILYVVFVLHLATHMNTVRHTMVSNLVVNLSGLILEQTPMVVALFCLQILQHLNRVMPQYYPPKRL
jgi:hypothetical protein